MLFIIVKRLLIILSLLSLTKLATATSYYFASTGSDSNPGTWVLPFKTLAKISLLTLRVGDKVYLHRGDVFFGSLPITTSGVTYSAYGTGVRPIITGLINVSSWVNDRGGVYESLFSGLPTLNMVTLNGTFQPIGRYPKLTDSNGGYIIFQSHLANSSVASNQISAIPSFVGGEIVIRANHWVLDRYIVWGQTKNNIKLGALIVPPTGYSGYSLSDGYGFFFQNHVNACTRLGEWCYDGTKKIKMFFGSANPSSYKIRASVINNLVTISSKNNLVFDNLTFSGANNNAFNISGSSNISISNCEIIFTGVDAIYTNSNCSNISVLNSTIKFTNNNVITANHSTNWKIRGNVFTDIAIVAGMGQGSDGQYFGLANIGSNSLIQNNEIGNCGYTAIFTQGVGIRILNNYVHDYCFVKDDGGGIYSYGNDYGGSSVVGNIVLAAIGAPNGTKDNARYAEGIYMDDGTRNVSISENTVANCADRGFYIHNAHELIVSGNTSFNNRVQLELRYDNISPRDSIRNVEIRRNKFISKEPNQLVFSFSTVNDDILKFGRADSNYYARPLNEVSPFSIRGANNLMQWQSLSGQDKHSKRLQTIIKNVNDLRFEYNTTASSRIVNLKTSYISIDSVLYHGTLTLLPYTSKVLIKISDP